MPLAQSTYMYEHVPGNHGDILKHTVFCAVIKAMQEAHPEGIMVVDAHAGRGMYDISGNPKCWHKVLEKYASMQPYQIPNPIQEFVKLQQAATNDWAQARPESVWYAGSPLLAQELLRSQDDHRLCDLFIGEMEGLSPRAVFVQGDCQDPSALQFFVPTNTDKHVVLFIDPPYDDTNMFGQTRTLIEQALDLNPYVTIIVWMPYIHGSRFRWSFAKSLNDVAAAKAKVGRYNATMTIGKSDLEGSAVLVCNPTVRFDDVVNHETVQWLAKCLQQGKDEFSVEQAMKKKKQKNADSA